MRSSALCVLRGDNSAARLRGDKMATGNRCDVSNENAGAKFDNEEDSDYFSTASSDVASFTNETGASTSGSIVRSIQEQYLKKVTDTQSTPKIQRHDATFHAQTIDPDSRPTLISAVTKLYSINDFETTSLGSGFYGDVYRAIHLETGEIMVMKKNKFKGNSRFVLKEIELLAKLSHPNILKHLGACVEGAMLHPLTEYINGGDLEMLLQGSEDLPWRTRMLLCSDIASGMAYLHSQDLLHRDLTSKNCLIKKAEPRAGHRPEQRAERRASHDSVGEQRLTAIICDYGLATKIPDPKCKVVKRLSIRGHPFWMSPECMKGKDYNQSSDVFSFGIITCEVLTRADADPDVLNRTRDFGLDEKNLAKLIKNEKVQPPQPLVELALACCVLDPGGRPSFQQIYESLTQIIQTTTN